MAAHSGRAPDHAAVVRAAAPRTPVRASDLKALPERGPVYAKLLRSARVLEGLARHSSVHAAGGHLYAWTVDDPAQIVRLEALGVDGVITNDPRLFDQRISQTAAL